MQECVSLAETYCTVECVTWGLMSDAANQANSAPSPFAVSSRMTTNARFPRCPCTEQAKWAGGVSSSDANHCGCQLRVALDQVIQVIAVCGGPHRGAVPLFHLSLLTPITSSCRAASSTAIASLARHTPTPGPFESVSDWVLSHSQLSPPHSLQMPAHSSVSPSQNKAGEG
jgi:hypothetical protein